MKLNKLSKMEVKGLLDAMKKDTVFSCRISEEIREALLEKHGSLQRFLDLAIVAEVYNLQKPLSKAIFNIDNKEALESYFGYEEPEDSLDKRCRDE